MSLETKLQRDQIIPYLDAYIRSFCPTMKNVGRTYVNISFCHRLIVNQLLRRHYTGREAECIGCTFDWIPFSSETTRRAVRDGVRMGIIDEVTDPTDRRRKLVKASALLVEVFEEVQVESPSDTRIDERKEIEKWVA